MFQSVHTIRLAWVSIMSATCAIIKDAVALDVMRAIKRTLNPPETMNPGKMIV